MRKMTKTVVTLAAMSAMTAAAASMAFAATSSYTATGKDAEVTATGTGDWDGDDVNGWTFTPTDGTKLKGTWAQINGVWYYFEKDGIMAQNKLLYLEGETYFFNADGSMMANGWVGFDKDDDILYDYDLDIDENIDDIQNKVFKNHEDAYETVWMYFNADGSAKDDEWYQADSGLWYRFDDVIMVCGDFDHEINGSRYGFDENGAMLVGWAENYNDKNINAPNKDGKTWYYYDSNGKKFDATSNNGYGWKKIDGKWYCFCEWTGAAGQYSVGTLITNAYFTNEKAANNGYGYKDFYYVDKNGTMATGVVTVDKDAVVVGLFSSENAGNQGAADTHSAWTDTAKFNKAWDVFFDKSSGAAKSDAWEGDRFYANANSSNVMLYDDDTYEVTAYKDHTVAVTGGASAIADITAADEIKGALVKSAFINKDDETYFVDKYGDKVKNSAVQVGYVNASKDKDNNYTDGGVLYDNEADAAANLTDGQIVCKAYIVVNNKGIAYDDIDAGRTVTVGAKKYVSTGLLHPDVDDAEVFYYYNKN